MTDREFTDAFLLHAGIAPRARLTADVQRMLDRAGLRFDDANGFVSTEDAQWAYGETRSREPRQASTEGKPVAGLPAPTPSGLLEQFGHPTGSERLRRSEQS